MAGCRLPNRFPWEAGRQLAWYSDDEKDRPRGQRHLLGLSQASSRTRIRCRRCWLALRPKQMVTLTLSPRS